MPRRYSQEEAQRVFALVADRQQVRTSDADGLSLSELEEAARLAGLEPSLVAAAAAEIDAAPNAERTLGGAPIEVVRHRMLTGNLDDDAWTQIVQAMRAEFGDAGIASQTGRLREWTLARGSGRNGTLTRLAVEPTSYGTRLTLTRSIRDAMLGFSIAAAIQGAMGVLMGIAALAAADTSLWVPALLMLVLGSAFGVATQAGSRIWHRRQVSRFEDMLDRFGRLASDSAPPPRRQTSTAPLAALLDEPDTQTRDETPAPRRVRD